MKLYCPQCSLTYETSMGDTACPRCGTEMEREPRHRSYGATIATLSKGGG